jgi:hypothetical protein
MTTPVLETPADVLIAEAATWQHNRSIYPGWLIAPDAVRERISDHTDYWIPFYITHGHKLDAVVGLVVLSELNWRLETALMPIWGELAPSYEQVLSSLNPFPENIDDLAGSPLSPETLVSEDLDWAGLRGRWLGVACGLLRFYREERQRPEFDLWETRLRKIKDLPPDTKARWCYERCLFALAEMNDEGVAAALGDWPGKTIDHFWTVRRAGVMAEVGDIAGAVPLLDEALSVVRSRSADTAAHIPALSQEGWVLWLGRGLRRSLMDRAYKPGGPIPDDTADRATLRHRFRQLRRFGADPEELSESLSVRLDRPPPRPTPPLVERVGFELGRVTRSTRFGGGFGKELIPAYQFMRLSEESGIPPGPGIVLFSEKHLVRAAEWFQEVDPVRTQSLMLRLLNKDVTEAYLSRHRVAALPADVVLHWRSIALRAIRATLPEVGRDFVDRTDRERRARERFQTAGAILARVLIRDTPAGLSELWDLAVSLYRTEAVRYGNGLDDPLKLLLQNLTQSTPLDQLETRFASLCNLAVPGETGFTIRDFMSWPDPVLFVGSRLASTSKAHGGEWREVVKRHLGLISGPAHQNLAFASTFSR